MTRKEFLKVQSGNTTLIENPESLTSETKIDRLVLRTRPVGPSLMRQYWGKLLFMHWAINPELLRPLIPSQLSIDTFDAKAWIGVVPFTMWGNSRVVPATNSLHQQFSRTQ